MFRLIVFFVLSGSIVALQAAPTLETVTVKRSIVASEQFVDGIVEAVKQATVSAQTSGTITRLIFDVNDHVTKGDALAEFKNTEQKAALKQAQANLDAALAQQRDTRAEHQRFSEVFKKGAISESQMDKSTAALKSANARLTAAEAALASAQEKLDYTVIRAPYSGLVTKRHVEIGEQAKPGTPIMTGLSLEDLRVLAQVPQRIITAVDRYQQARVLTEDNGKKEIISNLVTIFPYADAASHSFAVRVELPHGVEGLYPGMYVKVAFLVGEDEKMLIPYDAVAHRSEVTAVYVRQPDGSISMRQIRIGRERSDGSVEVLAGLDEGEAVFIDPQAAVIQSKQSK